MVADNNTSSFILSEDLDDLQDLACAYLQFLANRNESFLKPFLSLDFGKRRRVRDQALLIKHLPQILQYGLGLEVVLFDSYHCSHNGLNETVISPFQFVASYRELMNPLLQEQVTVTIHTVTKSRHGWVIDTILGEEDDKLLKRFSEEAQIGAQNLS